MIGSNMSVNWRLGKRHPLHLRQVHSERPNDHPSYPNLIKGSSRLSLFRFRAARWRASGHSLHGASMAPIGAALLGTGIFAKDIYKNNFK
jgi:hypothetical protein